MRISPSWVSRQHQCRKLSFLLVSSPRCALNAQWRHRPVTHLPSTLQYLYRHARTVQRSPEFRKYTSEPVPFVRHDSELQVPPKSAISKSHHPSSRVRSIPTDKIKDPESWVALLDVYLPKELRASPPDINLVYAEERDQEERCRDIVAILESARREQHTGVEILTHMVTNGRKEAALHIIAMLLDNVASRFPSRNSRQMPSNIQWPGRGMHDLCRSPIDLSPTDVQPVRPSGHWDNTIDDPRYSFILSETKETTMTEIWSMLGASVIAAADLSTAQASEVNTTVLLVLGQLHNLDLVPESVYSYQQPFLTATIRRPPMLHLVSSRILTAISDATWRQQQDKIIEKAARHGIPYETIGKDPPGGRFRLKVRPLGPEIWLEFILWCCVEGGFTSAGTRIIRNLRNLTENPWFAVTWSPSTGGGQSNPGVDWQRIRGRSGGLVGFKEGHSDEKPFVEMPSRTISTEVILGLVDASINTINTAQIRANGIQNVQKNVFELVSFLEPHDLPIGYFEYLAVRLMQSDAFNLPEHSYTLQTWYKRLDAMKKLQTAQVRDSPQPVLQLPAISAHSEVFAGILQQALDGCVQNGDVHRALDIFNLLQELVDTSKLQAIGSFLSDTAAGKPPVPQTPGVALGGHLTEFVRSHGQLPTYKLTGLLYLATDTGLTGFVQWLLYNDGPDGPLIPQSAFQNPGLAQALLRFATVSQDSSLLKNILALLKNRKRKPSVNFIRATINSHLAFLQFEQAHTHLVILSKAQGGGFGLINIAQLAAIIFKLESGDMHHLSSPDTMDKLRRGRRLLEQMLSGRFKDTTGAFQTVVRRRFRLQVGALLKVFLLYPNSILSSIGTQFADKYPQSNATRLDPMIFNYLMEAVVYSKGSMEGMQLWNLCCQSPDESKNEFGGNRGHLNDHEAYGNGQYPAETWGEVDDFQLHTVAGNETDESDHDASSHIGSNMRKTTTGQDTPKHNDEISNSIPFSNSFFPSSSTRSEIPAIKVKQLVNPSQQTLRLIIRAAVKERREILQRNGTIDVQKKVLAWAAKELQKFGATPRIISIEIEEPLRQAQIRKLDGQQYTLETRHNAPLNVRRVGSSSSE